MGTFVQPEKILKDLAGLWVDLGKQEENGVLRACALTFIVVVKDSHDGAAVGEAIAALMHDHPSRAIVIRVRDTSEPFLESRVLAQCWMPFGRNQQICCEQIEITLSLGSLGDVPTLIRSLIVPDLPVVLYCRDVELSEKPKFRSLLPLTGKLVIDSGSATNLLPIQYLSSLPSSGLRKADLTWSRLTRWRESIAQIFEDPEHLRAVNSLENIQILYTGDTEPVSVYYLAGWFMHVLGAGVHLNVARGVGPSCASIARIDLHGPSFEATVEMTKDCSVETRTAGIQQRVVFPELKEHDLLRQELSITGRDPIFDDVLGLAELMREKT